jgi:pimeloyl-ACP methyl ester carboxylesterase
VHVRRLGSGPAVVLVHGSVADGEATWAEQRALADRWALVIPDRPGFGANPPVERVDFEADAPLVADLLGDGAHLVGHSYGGVISLLAAALRPESVRSVTVLEPPALGVARGNAAVVAFIAEMTEYWASAPDDPEEFLRGFLRLVGSHYDPPSPLPPKLERGAELLRVERPPWEADIPLAELRAAPFPKLVASGRHHPAFDAVCDVLEQRLDAERAVIPGAGHTLQRTGRFNERLETFLVRASG